MYRETGERAQSRGCKWRARSGVVPVGRRTKLKPIAVPGSEEASAANQPKKRSQTEATVRVARMEVGFQIEIGKVSSRQRHARHRRAIRRPCRRHHALPPPR